MEFHSSQAIRDSSLKKLEAPLRSLGGRATAGDLAGRKPTCRSGSWTSFFLDTLPTRVIGGKAYDSDLLDRELAEHYGIEMIAPYRGERRTPTQDGRPLRRYSPTLASRTTIRLVPSLSSAGNPLGAPR